MLLVTLKREARHCLEQISLTFFCNNSILENFKRKNILTGFKILRTIEELSNLRWAPDVA